ncbi:hypothetical protein HY572_06540 [Candidatus Micrarchaeota archaeon]|nr:hypothetical protein [Candidatus Micrarchaeota archaeon]
MGLADDYVLRLLEAFKQGRMNDVKTFSGDAAREAFVHEDVDLVNVSLIAYALYKLDQKSYIRDSKAWKKFRQKALDVLEACKKKESDNHQIHDLLHGVHELSLKFGRFAQSVVEKGRLKAAAQMYAHGASLGKAVELSGAPIQEVASYIGATNIAEKYETQPIAKRLKTVRSLFS